MKKWILLFVAGLLFAPAAFAQSVGDPCTGTNRPYTSSGSSFPALICNGSTLELLEKDLSNPVRKGIGTATPAATLDINGEARIGNTSLACSGTTEGAIRYNGTSHELEYCNGTAWTSLSPAAGGGTLKVYNSDGVTVVGNYLGTLNTWEHSPTNGCIYTVYSDETTGVIGVLTGYDCSTSTPNTVVYFSGANCTGSTAISYAPGTGAGYCCTGSASCTTNRCASTGSAATFSYNSYRNSVGGSCVNTISSVTAYPAASPPCGQSPCVVK